MNADQDRLDELLGEVSDGRPIDWEAASREVPAADRSRAEALRDVAQIAEFNRVLQRSGPEAGTESSAAGEPGDSATLENWGSLLLLQQIGRGSHADVYRAWDLELRREVALKLLRTAPGAHATTEHSPLMEEARAAASVRHPNIVVVHGIDQHRGRVGLWMELVRGRSLEDLVRQQGGIAPDEVRRLGIDIGGAVEALHGASVLHRDLKPANVVRDESGRWVLTDFGLGSRSDRERGTWFRTLGTPMYLAPEVFEGAPHSVSTEVYSLGMLLWAALAGAHPFEVSDLAELKHAAASGPSRSLASLRPDAPPALIAAIERAIAPRAAARWGRISDLVDALSAIESDQMLVGAAHSTRATSATSATSSEAPAKHRSATPARQRMILAAMAACLAILGFLLIREVTAPARYDVEARLVRHEAGTEQTLLDGARVRLGDRLSLQVRATRPVWVYVLNEDERGERYLLFPQPIFEQANPIEPDVLVQLPGTVAGTPNAWTVTSEGGREHFLIVVSPEPVDELQAELDRLPAPRPDREVEYAQVGEATVERLRGVGGVAPLDEIAFEGGTGARSFDRFRSLVGQEQGVRGVWVRQIVLQNAR